MFLWSSWLGDSLEYSYIIRWKNFLLQSGAILEYRTRLWHNELITQANTHLFCQQSQMEQCSAHWLLPFALAFGECDTKASSQLSSRSWSLQSCLEDNDAIRGSIPRIVMGMSSWYSYDIDRNWKSWPVCSILFVCVCGDVSLAALWLQISMLLEIDLRKKRWRKCVQSMPRSHLKNGSASRNHRWYPVHTLITIEEYSIA